MAMNSQTTQPSPGTVNLARAFFEHIESLQAWARAGRINPRTMNVETLENLLQLTDNAGHVLRGLINGCRPVNRLPCEVLAAIFSFVPQPHSQATWLATFCSHKIVKVSDLLAITSTCRHWREVALTSSWLWSTVASVESQDGTGPPRPCTIYLNRCPAGPLRFLISAPVSSQILSILAEQRSRTSELVVTVVSTSHLETIASTPLSALQHCTFGHCQSTTPTVMLFPRGCPRLRTLSLDRVNFVPSIGFPSLTHLHMACPYESGDIMYSLCDVFAFLSGCPNLRTMFFEGPPGGFAISELPHGRPIVLLDYLERLVIIEHHLHDYEPAPQDDRMAFLRTFFVCVHIPPTCVVRLGGVSLVDLSYCTDLIGFANNPTSWRLYRCDNSIFTSASRVNIVSIQVFSPMDGRYLWLDIMMTPLITYPMDHEIFELSTALAQSAVFVNAREVWIEPGFAWLLNTGPEPLLSHMSRLESLVVCRDADEPASLRDSRIFQTLEMQPADSEPTGAAPTEDRAIACPRLATLRVDCMTDEDAVYTLRLSASRAAAGYPFERVILGRTFRGRTGVCMLHQYDRNGVVIGVGSARSDALRDHWMSQLSPTCLDESEDCKPYWWSWKWDPLRK